MSWRVFRKQRIRALETAIRGRKIDKNLEGLLKAISKNENLATLTSCSGRILLTKWRKEKHSSNYYRIWHKADREEVELAISGYALKQMLWFVVEPFSLSVAAKDADSAFAFAKKMEKMGINCSISKKKERYDIEAKGPHSMRMPVNPILGHWDDIVDIANDVMETNLELLKKSEKVKW